MKQDYIDLINNADDIKRAVRFRNKCIYILESNNTKYHIACDENSVKINPDNNFGELTGQDAEDVKTLLSGV